jgi:hypothetical protein
MNIEKIQEPLVVLVSFSGGAARPLRFRWNGRTYPVEAVNAHWVDRHGDLYELYYSLQSGGQTYLVHFSSKELQWWLDEIVME